MKNNVTLKMSVMTSLAGKMGGEIIKKKWHIKKKIPLSAPDIKRLKRKIKKMW